MHTRVVSISILAALCGCEALFGRFAADNSSNCVVNSSLCAQPDQACNPETRECEPAIQLTAIDPAASDELGGGTATLTGLRLSSDLRVRIGDNDATAVSASGSGSSSAGTALTLTIPPSPTVRGLVPIELIHPAGQTLRREGLFRYFSNTQLSGPQPIALPLSPRTIRGIDMNQDGRPDVVVGDGFGPQVAILLAQADGTLAAPRVVAVSGRPFALGIGDVNKDGLNDLAISLTGPTSTIEVSLGNSDGTFQTPTSVTTKQTLGGLGLADVNGDGRADLVAADEFNLRVWMANSNGTLATTSIDTPLAYQSFTTGAKLLLTDLNGDGRLDAVPINGRDFGFSVMYGDGSGGFSDAPGPTLQAAPKGVANADLNGDGRQDLVILLSSSGQLGLLLQSAAGRFDATPRYITTALSNIDGLAATDMNGDGNADLVVFSLGGNNGGLTILHGLGNGLFTAPRSYAMPSHPSGMLVTPLARPTRPDVFIYHTGPTGAGDFYSILRNETL